MHAHAVMFVSPLNARVCQWGWGVRDVIPGYQGQRRQGSVQSASPWVRRVSALLRIKRCVGAGGLSHDQGKTQPYKSVATSSIIDLAHSNTHLGYRTRSSVVSRTSLLALHCCSFLLCLNSLHDLCLTKLFFEFRRFCWNNTISFMLADGRPGLPRARGSVFLFIFWCRHSTVSVFASLYYNNASLF